MKTIACSDVVNFKTHTLHEINKECFKYLTVEGILQLVKF